MTEIKQATLPKDGRGNDSSAHRDEPGYVRRVLASTSPVPGSQETNETTLRIVPAALSEPIQQVSYIIDNILPRGYVTLLGGHGGSGKSLLALVLAAHCAAGKEWARLPAILTRTLFLTLEDPADLVRLRLRRIVAEYGLSAEAIESGITIADGTDGATLARESVECGTRRLLTTQTFNELSTLAAGHDLVIIDNASDAYGANENDRQMVRAFMAALARLAREHDAAVLLLSHIDKNAAKYGAAGNSYSGSTAWHNSARSRLALVSDDGGSELRHEKANLGRRIDSIPLEWTDAGVLVPASRNTAKTMQRDSNDEAALESAIRAASASGTNIPTARTGPATTQRVLETFPDLPDDLRGRKGRQRFWNALTRLERAAKITRLEYRDKSRHLKEGWALR